MPDLGYHLGSSRGAFVLEASRCFGKVKRGL